MDEVKEMLTAAEQGDAARVRELLARDPALAKAKGEHDVTPLHAAAERGRAEIAALLLEAGAELEAETTWGMTPLEWAANMGRREVAEVLLAHGARLNLWSSAGLGMLEAVKSFILGPGKLAPGAAQDRYHRTADGGWEKDPPPREFREAVSDAFHAACRNGHTEVARFLLEQGADVNARGFLGGTALHWAAGNGHRETVEFLLAQGARRDLTDTEFGATPRQWALEFHHTGIAELLGS